MTQPTRVDVIRRRGHLLALGLVTLTGVVLSLAWSSSAVAATSNLTLNPNQGPGGSAIQLTYTPANCVPGSNFEIDWDPGSGRPLARDTGQVSCPTISFTFYPPNDMYYGTQGAHTVEGKTQATPCSPFENYASATFTITTPPGNGSPPLPTTGGPCPTPTPTSAPTDANPTAPPAPKPTGPLVAPKSPPVVPKEPTGFASPEPTGSPAEVALGTLPEPSPTATTSGNGSAPTTGSGPLTAAANAFRAVTSTPAGVAGIAASSLLLLALLAWLLAGALGVAPQPWVFIGRLIRARRAASGG